VRDLIPDDPRIRLLQLADRHEIGEKRNFGCDRATGEYIAHWDDDDFSAPERLADQLARLEQSGKSVTGYHSMRFTDGSRWWRYCGAQTYSLGTALCYRRDWWERNRFDAVQIGEDNRFVMTAAQAGQIVSVDAGELMYATVHGGNTSPRVMDGDNWKLCA
jgi:glycosyltransferase involved in cell wall biosynthesis